MLCLAMLCLAWIEVIVTTVLGGRGRVRITI
jgi:hypothetical protein